MNAADLRDKAVSELQEELEGLLKEQFNMRMQKGSGQMTASHQMKLVRRNIARVKTVLNEKTKEGNAA